LRQHEVPLVSWIGLVDGGGGDTSAAVSLEPLLHLFGRGVVRRIRNEEVTVQRVAEGGRLVVAGDGLDRPLKVRWRLDRATPPRWTLHKPRPRGGGSAAVRPRWRRLRLPFVGAPDPSPPPGRARGNSAPRPSPG